MANKIVNAIMNAKVRLGRFTPDGETRASRMLALGRLTATVTSRATNRHVTLRLRAKDKEREWDICAYDEATHVFIEDYDGARIATYYPRTGVLFFADKANAAARWSVQALLRHLAGGFPTMPKVAEVVAADICGRCGQPLTDPESIERGFGPDCFGMITSSRHAALFDSVAA